MFDFLLSLDGKEQSYIDFCNEFEIPLLYSDEREGVGLSKNRVLSKFPSYDYYFFIEDDIELIDDRIFKIHIDVAKETGFHHFTSSGMQHVSGEIDTETGKKIIKADFGGGTFNFFTKKGLDTVGGWHTIFAKHRRYGHTEHTYRFYNAGLQPSPFLFIEETLKMTLIHPTPHVTNPQERVIDNRFIEDEGNLFHKKLKFYPLMTISDYHFNGFSMGFNRKVDEFLKGNNKQYPLLKGLERRKALAEYTYLSLGECKNSICRLKIILKTFACYPFYSGIMTFFVNRIKSYAKL